MEVEIIPCEKNLTLGMNQLGKVKTIYNSKRINIKFIKV